jgi:hypothetical protein
VRRQIEGRWKIRGGRMQESQKEIGQYAIVLIQREVNAFEHYVGDRQAMAFVAHQEHEE